MPTLVTDIDHTLCQAYRRVHLEGDWDRYNADAINDDPVHDTIALVRALKKAGWRIVALTARPEKWREITLKWLVTNQVPVDILMMRPNNNFDPSPKVKIDALKKIQTKSKSNILAIDDRLDVIEAFREAGITALHVSVGRNHDNTPRSTNHK